MDKKLKSLLALAIAFTLGLGFSSCDDGNDDPTPQPEPEKITTEFINSISFNKDFATYFDITVELTKTDGSVSSTNVRNCPTKKWVDYGNDIEYDVYMYKVTETTEVRPAQTTLKVNYSYNGTLPQVDTIACVIVPDFLVTSGNNQQPCSSSYGLVIDDMTMLDSVAEVFNQTFGNYVMKVDENGEVY
ncbi:MAG: hypothetical protein HUK15_06075, partial [Bacteroidales bacterium]|nr:hypothetical protein [Bacteroidales bacterium]